MPETKPTPTSSRSNYFLAWRIFRYLAIQGSRGLARLTWWLLVQSVRVVIGLGRLLSSPTPSHFNRARLGMYGWMFWRR